MMDSKGMMVLLVNSDSPAWAGEMKVGDILMEIDGREINLINDLYDAVSGAQGRTLTFKVIRKGQELLCRVSFPPSQRA